MCDTVGLVQDERYQLHDTGYNHPENSNRLIAIENALQHVDFSILKIPPRFAIKDELLLAHTGEYIDIVEQDVKSGKSHLSTGDTEICPASFDIAKLAVGGVLNACDAVMHNQVDCVFCAVRPPGHHAESNKGIGFCIFNNAAIAARYLQNKYGLKHILIVDWDFHHGNGTQQIFYADNNVLYFSVHAEHEYPGTGWETQQGEGAGKGYTINVNLAAGCSDKEILTAMTDRLLPQVETFAPEFIIISAGFDCLEHDLLGTFKITASGIVAMTKIVKGIAEKYADGRIVSVLEGGYNLTNLARAVVVHMRTLR